MFFANPTVNTHLTHIFNAYHLMIQSPSSLEYMNEEEPNGWFCPTALKHIDMDDYVIDKRKPHWGFKNWNDYFTKRYQT